MTQGEDFMRYSILGLLVLSLFYSGCASHSATPLSASAQASGATYYVENHGNDERNLEQIIASEFEQRGIRVSSGTTTERPADANYIVSYIDKWYWDMRTYLLELNIKVTEAATGAVVAESRSYQDSLAAMGKSYETIVRRATVQLFEGAP
jgi:hypothetical protein